MKNKFLKRNVLTGCLFLSLALILTSCLFSSDDNGLNSWLSDQGMPTDYKIETLSIGSLTPLSSEVFMDTTATSANSIAILGKQSNIIHDIVFDFAFYDEDFFNDLASSDSASSFLVLEPLLPFYKNENFPKDSLPLTEDLTLKLSWVFDSGSKKSFVDSVANVEDSTWYKDLDSWEADTSADTTYSISLSKTDTILKIDLPKLLVEKMKNAGPACHAQLRLSAPDAGRIYRFYGAGTSYAPFWSVQTLTDSDYKSLYPFRMAHAIKSEESSDGLVLHGGIYDSLVVEYPSKDIMKALSDFYGDEFPFNEGDKNDVRQAVILAQITFARDDSQGSSELGLPIQVVVGSYIDSAGGKIRKMENYRIDNDLILEEGHPNLIFHDGDSLKLQITYGVRDFINKASDGRTLKFMMRMGYPFLQEKDTTYANYKTDDGDSSYVFLSYFDYARYDFATSMKNPATLKLWLASKREGN